jgi:hypothetical protein
MAKDEAAQGGGCSEIIFFRESGAPPALSQIVHRQNGGKILTRGIPRKLGDSRHNPDASALGSCDILRLTRLAGTAPQGTVTAAALEVRSHEWEYTS